MEENLNDRITSLDITRRKFPLERRGYDRKEVDLYLASLGERWARREEQLRNARRQIKELEDRFEIVRSEMEEGADAVLVAAEFKQRLIEEATERATEILRAGYAASIDNEADVQRLVDADRFELLAVWGTDADGEPLLDIPPRQTRYNRRSAHLPSLGDATDRVMSDLAELRSNALRNS